MARNMYVLDSIQWTDGVELIAYDLVGSQRILEVTATEACPIKYIAATWVRSQTWTTCGWWCFQFAATSAVT